MKRLTGIVRGLILVAVVMLAAGLSRGYAQNTSALPYIDSWHRYQVTSDASANSVTWWLQSDETLSPVTRLDLSQLDNDGANWITRSTVGVTEIIDIKFVDAQFNSGQTWYLIFSEWDNTVGTGNCVARRSMRIDIVENTFYLSLGGDMSICNPLDGDVLNWNNVDTEPIGTGVPFRITMNKAAGFAANTWTFSGSLTGLTGGYTVTSATSSEAHGSDGDGTTNDGYPYTITYNTGAFTVTVTGSSTVVGVGESDYIDILVWITGRVWIDTQVTLTISNGQATSGTAYTVNTDDNGSGDKIQVYTINELPGTSNIVQNEF